MRIKKVPIIKKINIVSDRTLHSYIPSTKLQKKLAEFLFKNFIILSQE